MKRNINKPTMKNTVLILTIGILIAACGGKSKDAKAELEVLKKQKSEIETKITELEALIAKTDTSAKSEVVTEVITMPLQAQIFKTYIEIQGRVDADESVGLSSEMLGMVTKINVKAGDQVSKGDILAETDSRAIQQQISDLQTNYELAKQVAEKQESLWKQKIGTEIQYLQAKTNKESLEKKMATLQEQLRMSRVISPINGTVDGVNIKIGQTIMPGMSAINVVNFNSLKVKADVAESYSARVKNGNEVLVLFPDMNDSVVTKVNYASRAINAVTRTFAVEAVLNNGKEYHPNMVAKVKINDFQSEKPELVVPIKYVQRSTNESYVMIEEKGKAVRRVITLGREYNGNAEVLNGLKDGDLLITAGYDLVNEGDKVVSKK